MTSALYLEQYLDSLEHLPIELQRNFTLMRDLDARAQNVMRNIDKMADEYLQNVKMLSAEKKKEKMSEIQAQFNKAKEFGDDKVQLAIQTYELVDKHIRRLDSDLARFESEIQDKALSNTRSQEDTDKNNRRGRKKQQKEREGKKKRVGVGSSGEEEGGKSARKKAKKGGGKNNPGPGKGAAASAATATDTGLAAVLPGITHTTDVTLDMPVDPNEPTYCLCHQVSYGEMIGCDNPDCPIEWFHFACVGLTTKPKGKWFCPKCIADRKKK